MKIQGILSQTNKSDILELNGNELTINGLTIPLDNLPVYPTEENADIQAFLSANLCYTENGIDHIKIYVDNQHFFLFVNNNYLLHCDKDLDGELNLSELLNFINFYNLSEDDRKVEYKKNIDKYEKKTGKKKGDWNKLCREVKKDKMKISEK